MNDVFAPKRIVGITARVPGRDTEPIVALWAKFFQQGLPQRLAGGLYSVWFDYESDDTGSCSVLVGCEVPAEVKLPKGLAERWIEPGAYHVVDASGELPGSMHEAWRSVWSTSLKRTYRTDFEEYLPDHTQTLYVGVVPEADGEEAAA